MEFIAVVMTIVAIVFFVLEARANPWSLGWLGIALLASALLIWHSVGGMEPVFNK